MKNNLLGTGAVALWALSSVAGCASDADSGQRTNEFEGSGGDGQFGNGGQNVGGYVPGAGGYVPGAGGYVPGAGGSGLPPASGGSITIGNGGTDFGAGGAPPGSGGGVVGGAAGSGVGGMISGGTCCSNGDCLCHGPDPTKLTSAAGPFKTATFTIPAGTVNYPTDATPPFAGVAICPGFLNTGPEMAPWGAFYASHGIVTVVTSTLGGDFPDVRATKLLAAITQLKAENTKSGSPLMGKLAGRYGTSGYSMGGGGTTIASGTDATLRTSIGLAPWGPVGTNVKVPTLLLCGSSDTTAPCSQAQGAYTQIPATTPKMMLSIAGATHFNWFGPTNAGNGISGQIALAFEKVFLEGDERWKPLLKTVQGTPTTNIQ